MTDTAADRRGVNLSSAPEHVQATLNRIMYLEDERERLEQELRIARYALARVGAVTIDGRDENDCLPVDAADRVAHIAQEALGMNE